MTPRIRLILLLVAGLMAVTLLSVNLWHRYTLPGKVAEWRSQLTDEEPAVRIAAAESILRLSRDDAQARLVLATAYLDSLRFGPARDILQPLMITDSPSRIHALILMADSYLLEAGQQAADIAPSSADLASVRIEALLNEAQTLQRTLATMPEAGAVPLLMDARIFDIRATVVQTKLRTLDIELSKATAADAESQVHAVGVQLAEWRGQLNELNQRVEALCLQALSTYPGELRPHALLVRRFQRLGDQAKIRQTLELLAQHKGNMDRVVVGQVILAFLDLEWSHGWIISKEDWQLVDRLLHHASLTGTRTIDFRLAQTQLALQRADWETVLAQARETMRVFEGHPRAICQYNLALAQMGQLQEAMRNLAALNDKRRSPYAKYTLGRLYLLDHQPKMAMEQFRQALDLENHLVAPRLAIVQTLIQQGYIQEAANDIRSLYRRAPLHPEAVQAHVQVMVEFMELENLATLVRAHSDPAGDNQGWQAVGIVTALLLDDLPTAQGLARQRLKTKPIDVLANVALVLDPKAQNRRFQLAGMLAAVMLDMMDADPLQRLVPPRRVQGLADLARPGMASQNNGDDDVLSMAINPNLPPPTTEGSNLPVVGAVDLASLSLGRFVPPSYRAGLELAEAALDRWPGQQLLRRHALTLSLLAEDADARELHWLTLSSQSDNAADNIVLGAVAAYERLDWSALQDQLQNWPIDDATYPDVLRTWLDLSQLAAGPGQAGLLRPAMRKALHDHPWCEPILLSALRETLARRDLELTFGLMQDAKQITPQMALLTSARLGLATQRLHDAGGDLELLLTKEGTASELRIIAADPNVQMLIALGRTEQAAGLLERLGTSCHYRRYAMLLSAADLLQEMGRSNTAVSILTAVAADPQISPRWLDAALQRLVEVLPAERAVRLLDNMMQLQPGQWVVRVHQALALIKAGDMAGAREVMSYLERVSPGVPRLAGLQVQIALSENKLTQARRILEQWQQQGGRAGRDATLWLAELEATTDKAGIKPLTDRGGAVVK